MCHRASFFTADFCHSWPERFRRPNASDSWIQQGNRRVLDRRDIVGLSLAERMLITQRTNTEEAVHEANAILGRLYVCLRLAYGSAFQRLPRRTFSVVRLVGSGSKLVGGMTCSGVVWGTSKDTTLRSPVDSWYEEIHYLKKENGRWRIVGNVGGESIAVLQFGVAPHPLF